MSLNLLITITPRMRHLSALNTTANTSSASIIDAMIVILILAIFFMMMRSAKYNGHASHQFKRAHVFAHRSMKIASAVAIACIMIIGLSCWCHVHTPDNAVAGYQRNVRHINYLKRIYPKLKPHSHVKYMHLSNSLQKDARYSKHTKKVPGKLNTIQAYHQQESQKHNNNPARLQKPSWYLYL